MNEWIIFGILNFIIALVIFFFHEPILRILGPSKKSDYPIEVRRRKLLVGGFCSLFIGLIALLKGIELL